VGDQHEAEVKLADNLSAIACAIALLDLAAAHEQRPDQLLADFGLTRARVSSVLMQEMRAAEFWLEPGRVDEPDALARAHGWLDAASLASWLATLRAQHEAAATQVDTIAGVAGVVLVGAVLTYLLTRLRSDRRDFDAFADRGLDRQQIVALVRRTSERLFSAAGELELSWRLLESTEAPRTEAPRTEAPRSLPALYIVSDSPEIEHGALEYNAGETGLAPANERPAVGALLARLRTARGLTRAELASRAGLSLSTVRGIEVGERDAKIKSAKALAAALDLPFVQFAAMIGADL